MTTPAVKNDAVKLSRGENFRARVNEVFALESIAEIEVLAEIVATLDEIDLLKIAIEQDGVTVTGSTGQTRTHPALTDIRSHRLALQRLLSALGLPSEDEISSMKSPVQLRSAHANKQRWGGARG